MFVVVTGVERDFATGFGDGARTNVQGLIAMEWRDLDGDDVFRFRRIRARICTRAHGQPTAGCK